MIAVALAATLTLFSDSTFGTLPSPGLLSVSADLKRGLVSVDGGPVSIADLVSKKMKRLSRYKVGLCDIADDGLTFVAPVVTSWSPNRGRYYGHFEVATPGGLVASLGASGPSYQMGSIPSFRVLPSGSAVLVYGDSEMGEYKREGRAYRHSQAEPDVWSSITAVSRDGKFAASEAEKFSISGSRATSKGEFAVDACKFISVSAISNDGVRILASGEQGRDKGANEDHVAWVRSLTSCLVVLEPDSTQVIPSRPGFSLSINKASSDCTAAAIDEFQDATGARRAMVWTKGGGLIPVADVLTKHGIASAKGWRFDTCSWMSADSRTLAGSGRDLAGRSASWWVRLPANWTTLTGSNGKSESASSRKLAAGEPADLPEAKIDKLVLGLALVPSRTVLYYANSGPQLLAAGKNVILATAPQPTAVLASFKRKLLLEGRTVEPNLIPADMDGDGVDELYTYADTAIYQVVLGKGGSIEVAGKVLSINTKFGSLLCARRCATRGDLLLVSAAPASYVPQNDGDFPDMSLSAIAEKQGTFRVLWKVKCDDTIGSVDVDGDRRSEFYSCSIGGDFNASLKTNLYSVSETGLKRLSVAPGLVCWAASDPSGVRILCVHRSYEWTPQGQDSKYLTRWELLVWDGRNWSPRARLLETGDSKLQHLDGSNLWFSTRYDENSAETVLDKAYSIRLP